MAPLRFPNDPNKPPKKPLVQDERKGPLEVPFERRRRKLYDYKAKVHHEVINKIDIDLLVKFDNETARREVMKIVESLVAKANLPLSISERKQVVEEVVNETFGLGPLESLLADPSIDDILVNNYHTVYIERRGKLVRTDTRFKDDTHLRHIINRIVAKVGRRIDESCPMVDARLPDGSRVNAIIPPLALDGPALSIRRFKKIPLTVDDMVSSNSMSQEMVNILQLAIKARMNIIVSGGTGAGKTTLMNVLSGSIPMNERIVTIEDAAELQLQQPHVLRLETRPSNMEGKGQVTARDLFVNSLRMRPDRIIVGEVRGGEALEMLQAMNTGHDGSMTTVHANTPRDAIARIETMVLMENANMQQSAVRMQIASAVNIIVQVRRYPDGIRRISSIQEVTGMESTVVSMQEIASFERTGSGVGSDGKIKGNFIIHPVRPKFIEIAKERGINLGSSPMPPSSTNKGANWKGAA